MRDTPIKRMDKVFSELAQNRKERGTQEAATKRKQHNMIPVSAKMAANRRRQLQDKVAQTLGYKDHADKIKQEATR